MADEGARALELMALMQNSKGSAVRNLMNGIYWSTYTFQKNADDLLTLIDELEDPENVELAFLRNRDVVRDAQMEIARRLHNFVSAAQSLIDHSRIASRRLYQEDEERLKEYQRRVTEEFASDPLSRFVIGLRQYCLHYRLPFVGFSLKLLGNSLEHSFFLNRDLLKQYDGWPADAKSFLDEAPEQVDFHQAIVDYRQKVVQFYQWFEKDVRALHESSFAELREYEKELAVIELRSAVRSWKHHPEAPIETRIENLFVQVLSTEELDALEGNPAERIRKGLSLVEKWVDLPADLRQELEALADTIE